MCRPSARPTGPPSAGTWRGIDDRGRGRALSLRAGAGPHRARRHRHAARLHRAGRLRRRLGNDVSRLEAIVPTVATLLALFRHKGWPVIHTRESHRPDLSDCPPAKRHRGNPALRIGDEGPMGRMLVRGEPGNAIIETCAPHRRRDRDRQARQGHVLRTPTSHAILAELGVTPSGVRRRHDGSLRPDLDARGQ